MFARIIVLVTVAVLFWSVAARPSGAGGHEMVYRVQPYDTLWSIASGHYGGDVRDAVYRIERENRLRGPTLTPGQTLVLP